MLPYHLILQITISWFMIIMILDLLILGFVKKYFRIRSALCNKDLCANGEKSSIVICESDSDNIWFQGSDSVTIRWKNDHRLVFDGEGNLFTLTNFTAAHRQFWFIYEDRIANRCDTSEVVDLKDSNCSNGAVIWRLPYNASAKNQKWDFLYIN